VGNDCDTRCVHTISELQRRGVRLEYLTIAWSALEASAALVSGLLAGSVALTAFGADSGIEMISAVIVLNRLKSHAELDDVDQLKERRALQSLAVLFFALAAYVVVVASIALIRRDHPSENVLGLVTCLIAVVAMPALAKAKRTTANQLTVQDSCACGRLLMTDAVETALCGWLSVSTVVGVVLGAWIGWWWADPAASLVVVYFAIREGREAWRGELD
jgi:divalent metal cation (Fe/Co/Zn/Cd) transporter